MFYAAKIAKNPFVKNGFCTNYQKYESALGGVWLVFVFGRRERGVGADQPGHRARVDLRGGRVIHELEGGSVVVGDGLSGGCLHSVVHLGASVVVAEDVDVAVVEAHQDDQFAVHRGGNHTEQLGLESGVEDFEGGAQRASSESALRGVLQFAHVVGAVDMVEGLPTTIVLRSG